MRYILLIMFGAISFSAHAQWYRIDQILKKKLPPFRPAVIEQATDHSVARLPHVEGPGHAKLSAPYFCPSDYSYDAAEDIVMKEAQHNMRFRIYTEASYNFSDLARLYMLQNRFSEAKWYLLQSNNISRRQNDDKHTVENLTDLAMIKTNIGDYSLALEDLTEAYNMACLKGLNEYLSGIENQMLYIKQNRLIPSKLVRRYAETPQNNSKAE